MVRKIFPFLLTSLAIAGVSIFLFSEAQQKSSAEVQYISSGESNSTPSLSSKGKWVVVVWTSQQKGGTNVYAATSSDGGRKFGSPVRVNEANAEADVYGENPPRVVVSDQEKSNNIPQILVTWSCGKSSKFKLRSAVSNDGGKSFLPSTSVGDPKIEGVRGFQSLASGKGNVVAASWLDSRRDPGEPPHANSGHDWDPMHLMYGCASGNSWNFERRLATNVCGCCKTAIATDSHGSVYVAFRNIYPGNLRDISLTVSRDGKEFSKPVRVSEDHWSLHACPDDGPTMVVDQKDVVHIVWPTFVEKPESAMRFFHSATTDGIKFTARKQLQTLGTTKPAHAQMSFDSCGKLSVVWDEAQGETRRIVYQQLTPLANGDIQPGQSQIISTIGIATYPVIASSEKGIVVAWTESN
ncbi:MAG TPA: sialidase family protein, partial [Acidobacteriota bacterium]